MDNLVMPGDVAKPVAKTSGIDPALVKAAREAYEATTTKAEVEAWGRTWWLAVGYKVLGEIVSGRLDAVAEQKAKKAAR